MTEWVEYANLVLGVVGAAGTVGIFILVWQWWIDTYSKHPYTFLTLDAAVVTGGTFYNTYVKVRNRASHSLRLILAVQERRTLTYGDGKVERQWVTPIQQVMRDPVMEPVEKGMVRLDPKDIGDIRIRVEKTPGLEDPTELRLQAIESITNSDPAYLPLPKRV